MKLSGFYAYPSENTSKGLVFTIKKAIDLINSSNNSIEIKGWEASSVTGHHIIDKVTESINEADVFLCDLTYMNQNVLFELGYAIISDKPIWISVDNTLQDKNKFTEELGLLTTVGYSPCTNSGEIATSFLKDSPFNKLEDTLYRRHVDRILESDLGEPTLFYMKSPVSTDASLDLTKHLATLNVPLVTDNPQEVSRRTFDWYLEKIYQSFAVVTHFLDETREQTADGNARYAFISGMAYGAGKQMLMLAHSPFVAPIDFRDLVTEHETPEQCISGFEEWWHSKAKKAFDNSRKKYRKLQRQLASSRDLLKINVGEYVAEDEEQSLGEYFIPTSAYEEALRGSNYRIFVGRKGTGKTANLYRIAHELRKRRQQDYHVCTIKPTDYQLEDIFLLFRIGLTKGEKSFLAEVLWKFLVYTELAQSVYVNVHDKPSPMRNQVEQEFCDFVDEHSDVIEPEFTERLEHAIRDLCKIDISQIGVERKKRISEILHDSLLNRLRSFLGKLLKDKKKVVILIDNLDKAWEKRHDLSVLSQFLFGLLNVGETIPTYFQRHSSILDEVHLSLIIFLRSDIFSVIAPHTRERDRLKYSYINWNDPQLLESVIEKRLVNSLTDNLSSDELWGKFFCLNVNGIPTRTYLVEHVMPRPRDIIYFCKEARSNAINHGHLKIEEVDLLQAEKEYSKYCYASLRDETEARFDGDIEDLLIEFAGSPEVVTREMIFENMEVALISEKQYKDVIDLLCDVTFLGLETEPNRFEFIYDEMRKRILHRKAKRIAKETGKERYRINVPYHSFLGILTSPS